MPFSKSICIKELEFFRYPRLDELFDHRSIGPEEYKVEQVVRLLRNSHQNRGFEFFEVDAESIALATLEAFCKRNEIDKKLVHQAIKDLGIDPEKKSAVMS